jgi:hypothetical protein
VPQASPREDPLSAKKAASVEMIKRRFTGAESAVERAFETSESFRGLCRDFIACAATLGRWSESRAEDAPLRVQEYSELLGELTREIEERLRAQGR